MVKNIDNIAGGGGASISNTDSLAEGINNLYFTETRTITALQNDNSYKNAESIYGVPVDGPSTQGGQLLISNGVNWVTSNNLVLNNSNMIIGTGSYISPNAYFGRFGPSSYLKLTGNNKVLTVYTADIDSGYIEFFVSSRLVTTGTKYHMHQSIDYENISGTVIITKLAGFQSPEYTINLTGGNIEVFLNTIEDSRTTVTMNYQTITGANIATSTP